MSRRIFLIGSLLALGILLSAALVFSSQINNSCLACHKGLDDKNLSEPANYGPDDVHAKISVSCVDCHGGDPASDDASIAMDIEKGFIGKPLREDISKICAKCHSDSEYMKLYNPNLPTDQLNKYEMSQHGKLSAQGDQKAAVCTSCHNAHNILAIKNPASPAYDLNAPSTCAKCHSDKEYMKEYGIPTHQIDEYKESIHGQALLVKGDRSSPSCKHCHGNHDAGLPKAIYLGNICSQCHALTYELFSKSPHKSAYEKEGIAECQACHGSHRIMKPSDDMIGTGADSICLQCHDSSSRGFLTASGIKESIEGLKTDILQAKELAEKAEQLGIEVEDTLLNIEQADNSLIKSRAYIHTFSKEEVGSVVDLGKVSAVKAKEAAQEAINKFNFRRKWYAFVVFLIFVFSLALYVRIKILERGR